MLRTRLFASIGTVVIVAMLATVGGVFVPAAGAADPGRPAPWLATNGQTCDWGVPAGTILSGETESYIFTNCTSANIFPGKELKFGWEYLPADFEFLMNGEKGAEGVAWWGPTLGSLATVSYNDSASSCTGRSFEVVPGVQITGVITNSAGATNAVWSQGDWGKPLQKLYPPECRPNMVQQPAPATTPNPVQKSSEEMLMVSDATYGPFSFKGSELFQIQHLSDWVFHIKGWAIVVTPGDVCIWYDWSTGIEAPPWSGDYRVICSLSTK